MKDYQYTTTPRITLEFETDPVEFSRMDRLTQIIERDDEIILRLHLDAINKLNTPDRLHVLLDALEAAQDRLQSIRDKHRNTKSPNGIQKGGTG